MAYMRELNSIHMPVYIDVRVHTLVVSHTHEGH